jgi:type I restriction enzyme S subunit
MKNVPELRFKDDDGEDFPEWEEKVISELVKNISLKFNPKKHSGSFKCIELEHLSKETGELLGYVDAADQKSIKTRFNKNDVLFGKLRPYLKKFLIAPFDGVCSTEIWVLQGKEISNSFLYQLVQTEAFLTLTNIAAGTKMPRADWKIIASATIQCPSDKEQTKIANFLSAIDDKINQTQKQLDNTKQYKKGLLQKMFV